MEPSMIRIRPLLLTCLKGKQLYILKPYEIGSRVIRLNKSISQAKSLVSDKDLKPAQYKNFLVGMHQ